MFLPSDYFIIAASLAFSRRHFAPSPILMMAVTPHFPLHGASFISSH